MSGNFFGMKYLHSSRGVPVHERVLIFVLNCEQAAGERRDANGDDEDVVHFLYQHPLFIAGST